MTNEAQPKVSVVTPVYNDAEYLAECIESVLNQTYGNWEYIIVNNCSTDGSGEIAHRYASRDSRIRVIDSTEFLRAVPNHNFSMRQISPDSKYCKIVFADDWIFPRCLEDMTAAAEANPSAGIIGAYGMQGTEVQVKWTGLPYPSHLVNGKEICRRYFRDGLYVFGTSTSVLFRADLVRARPKFFNESNLHADIEICLVLLRDHDFAFVHQVLSFTRERAGSLTALARDVNTIIAARLYELNIFGHEFLSDEEFEFCKDRLLGDYYNYLAIALISGRRDKKFWDLHRRKFKEAGVNYSSARLAGAAVVRAIRALLHPHETVQKLKRMH